MSPATGRSAAEFQILDTQGTIHRKSDYSGRWLLLVFHRHLG